MTTVFRHKYTTHPSCILCVLLCAAHQMLNEHALGKVRTIAFRINKDLKGKEKYIVSLFPPKKRRL